MALAEVDVQTREDGRPQPQRGNRIITSAAAELFWALVVLSGDKKLAGRHVDVPETVARRLKRFRCDDGLRHGDLAHRLPRLFRAAGLIDVAVEGTTLVLDDPDDAFGLPTWPRVMHDRGLLDLPEVERFEADVRAAADAGDFLYAVTFFITSGRRP